MPGQRILEYFESGPIGNEAIDADNGVIRGVKFLGERSANPPPNNNTYPRSTREKAAALLEGARININHPVGKADPLARPYEHGLGVARNVRETGTGLHGDFHFNPAHPLASQIIWDARNAPQRLGFSINAFADNIRNEAGQKIIEGISQIYSIDLVSRPATARGLFESRTNTMTIYEALKAAPRFAKHLQLIEDMYGNDGIKPIMGQDFSTDDLSTDEAGIEAMCSMIKAAAKEGDWEKVSAIVDAFQGLLEDQANSAKGAGEDGDPSTAESHQEPPVDDESKRLREEETKQLREHFALQLKARDMASDAGVKLTKVLRKALDACQDEKEVTELIEEEKAKLPPANVQEAVKPGSTLKKPQSSAPGQFRKDRDDDKRFGKQAAAPAAAGSVQEAQKSPLVGGETPDEIQANRIAFFRGQRTP